MGIESHSKIAWWRTEFGKSELQAVIKAFEAENISQGEVTRELEQRLSVLLKVPHVIAVSNGSAALTMALMALGVSAGDEVIMPNRTWIATAHAVHILGAKVVLVDVEDSRPIIDVNKIETVISNKTKVIIPVHLNGRSANMVVLNEIAKRNGLNVVEDAAQALFSKNQDSYLGTQSDIGCFSLSVTKLISTGQGGFVVTKNDDLAVKLRAMRTHGTENVTEPGSWEIPGFNFRITDLQSSIGVAQLSTLSKRTKKVVDIYDTYLDGLNGCPGIEPIPIRTSRGEVPIYNEFLCDKRNELANTLEHYGISTRPFLPNISRAKYLWDDVCEFPNSIKYEKFGITLPSGPGQSLSNIQMVVERVNQYFGH